MGSEGPSPSPVTVHVTGFKKFHGVSENPTETIVKNLKGYVEKEGLPKGLVLGSCTILETAGQGAVVPLYQTLQSAVCGKDSDISNNGRIIWLHLGVNSGAAQFAIERQAVNEATFRCPDEMGWKPQKVPIIPADGEICHTRQTTLPIEDIRLTLAEKKGYKDKVMISDDAGRFVCNYVYYHSLSFAEQNGTKSLFVHVPLFITIDESTQMQFIASLLEPMRQLFNKQLLDLLLVSCNKPKDFFHANQRKTCPPFFCCEKPSTRILPSSVASVDFLGKQCSSGLYKLICSNADSCY